MQVLWKNSLLEKQASALTYQPINLLTKHKTPASAGIFFGSLAFYSLAFYTRELFQSGPVLISLGAAVATLQR